MSDFNLPELDLEGIGNAVAQEVSKIGTKAEFLQGHEILHALDAGVNAALKGDFSQFEAGTASECAGRGHHATKLVVVGIRRAGAASGDPGAVRLNPELGAAARAAFASGRPFAMRIGGQILHGAAALGSLGADLSDDEMKLCRSIAISALAKMSGGKTIRRRQKERGTKTS